MEDKIKRLDRVFNPRAVAVVGDKKMSDYSWLRNQKGFKGRLYSVNIDPNEFEGIAALGVKNYLSLMDIPDDEIDYVIVAVPREVSPIILRDCIKKGVGGAMFFTSGFAETSTEKGIMLQETLTKMAKEADFPLIGPNCMGLFNPRLGVSNSDRLYSGESGQMGIISQSGTHTIGLSGTAYANGVKASKAISIGNSIALEATDYLEYFMQDEETKIIGMYVESVKDGRKFFRLLRECTRTKPVIIWKGGQTADGTRATASHTGSLAEPMVVWEAMFKQAGAISANNTDDVIDYAKALINCRPCTGYRMGLLSNTGGQSVYISDSFAKAGLKVPDFSAETYERFSKFFSVVGGSFKNPIDMGQNWAGESIVEILDLLDKDPNVDAIAVELSAGMLRMRQQRDPTLGDRLFTELSTLAKQSKKPIVTIVSPLLAADDESVQMRARIQEMNVPAYHTFERAARALKNMIDYYRFLEERG